MFAKMDSWMDDDKDGNVSDVTSNFLYDELEALMIRIFVNK